MTAALLKKECKKLARKIYADLKGRNRENTVGYYREFRIICTEYCTLSGKDKNEFSEHLFIIGSDIDNNMSRAKADMLRWIDTLYSDLTEINRKLKD